MAVKLCANHFCAVLSASHHDDNVEDLKEENDDGSCNGDDGPLDLRDDDPEENLDFVCTINTGSFEQVFRYAFQS